MSDRRIALFTVECAQTGAAMAELVRRHPEVRMIVTSDVTRPQRGNSLQQAVKHTRDSGLAFVGYLLLSFQCYAAWLIYDRARSALLRKSRTRLSISELCVERQLCHIHTQNVNGVDVVRAMRKEGINLIVVYWFDQILRQAVIELPALGVINVHAAPLPECRGLWPVLFSAIENDRKFGITAHMIEDEQIDAGPILGQVLVTDAGHSVIFQDDVVNRSGITLLSSVLENLLGTIAAGREQVGGSYFSHPTKAQIRSGAEQGVKLWSIADALSVYRSSGAVDGSYSIAPGVAVEQSCE